jgi:hypothetical protein
VPLAYPDSSTFGQLQNTRLRALAQAVEKSTQLNAALAQCKDVVSLARRYTSAATNGIERAWRRYTRNPAVNHPIDEMVAELARHWREVPSEYLAYLYGVAPLGDDLANGLDRLSSYRLKGYSLSMLLKSTRKVRSTRVETWNAYAGTGLSSVTAPVNRTTITKAVYRFDIPSWYLDTSPTLSPFSTAYELTRYSFVLDWFVPVGQWLQALESAQFSPFFKEGSETWYIKDSMDLSAIHSDNFSMLAIKGRLDRGAMKRTAVGSFPSTVLARPIPNPLPGLQQAVQGFSLLTQAFQRSR